MHGIIVNNRSFFTDAVKNQNFSLIKAFNDRGVHVESVFSDELGLWFDCTGGISGNFNTDFAIWLDKDILLASMVAKKIKVFNNPESIRICDDKALTFFALSEKGIPMPETIPAPMIYFGKDSTQYRQHVEEKLGYPVVVKGKFGSMGREVFLANNREELDSLLDGLKTQPHLCQKFFGTKGRDIRAIVIGGEVVSAMERSNLDDFRANISGGGVGKKCNLSTYMTALCKKCANILNLDYCGVDLLFDGQGNVKICEVNSNAFFEGITIATGVDVAGKYAEHIISHLNNHCNLRV